MKIVHFCAGLEYWNGMANTARQFVEEERSKGEDSLLTNRIGDIVAGVDAVVIHGAWLPTLWKAAKRAKMSGAKLVVRPAGSYDPVRLAYHGWKKKMASFFEHRMLRRADVLLATCNAEVEWIRRYEPGARKIDVTDLKRFFALDRVEKEGVERGEDKPCRSGGVGRGLRLLYLGRRHPLKGVEYLESAVRQMQKSAADSGCSRTTNLNDPQLSTRAVWLNKLELRIVSNASGDELKEVWEWCDALVLPTLSDNFGRVIAEALERGKRVITTDGAPAWGDGNTYGGRLTYLRGYRDGTPEERIRLLRTAIENLSSACLNWE